MLNRLSLRAGGKKETKMRNRTICIVSAFLMALVVVGCVIAVNAGASDSTVSSATIYYVPDDYATIQEAVNNAAAGDTIIVRDGTYLENVKVNKRLTIRSENGPANTIVESPEGVNDHVLTVTADHVRINGLTVKNATGKNKAGRYNYSGLYISAHHCDITDNMAINNAYGFFLSESSKNRLINNIASDHIGDGIYVISSSSNTISNNMVKRNPRYGIRLYGSHNNTVRNNNVSNSIYGIRLESSHINTVRNNNVSGNGYGIRLAGSHNNTIEKNNVQSNTYDGIFLFYSNDNSFVNNTASQNNYDGFFINASYNNTLINNVANANKYDGFGLELVNNHTLINNKVNSNNKSGISLRSSNGNLLEDNVASLNTEMGFYLLSSTSNTLAGNKASANKEVGIQLDKSGNCALTNNMMEGNDYNFGVDGANFIHFYHDIDASNRVDGKPIYYWINQSDREIPKDAGFVGIINSKNVTARDLTLTKNSVGLLLAYSVNSGIENVTVSNTDDGITLLASSYSLIANNTISNNDWGINMVSSENNFLIQNTITKNQLGVLLSYSNNNTLVGNNISNNWEGLSLLYSYGNLVFTNNFINNSAHSTSSTSIWNSVLKMTYIYKGETYTNFMGNYWSSYFKDIYGTMDIELDTDGDGIADFLTPYTLPTGLGTDKDNYPLMQPYENYLYVTVDE
jgi:parallel beta-helix repeat protein